MPTIDVSAAIPGSGSAALNAPDETVRTVSLAGAPAEGETWALIVDGLTYQHTVSGGQNLAWSYRHGGSGGASASANDVRSNAGEINALFFDGHVARLDDRASREIEYWYPSGTTVVNLGDGLTDLPMDYEVP